MIVLWRLRDAQRNCHKIIDLPSGTYLETAKSKYNNGVFEITFGKKEETKPKGKQIKITKKLRAESLNLE
jgi:HSP20 family protein